MINGPEKHESIVISYYILSCQNTATNCNRLSESNDRTIDWDSVTLAKMPGSVIEKCEEAGWNWRQMYLEATEVELSTPRDTTEDVATRADQLQAGHTWDFLGEAGRRIQAVLADVDPEDERGVLQAWEAHLRDVLRFPFAAKVAEFQERSPLQTGDGVTVQGFMGIDDLYGILVKVRHKRRTYHFPLCDLEVNDPKSSNYGFLRDYVVWFANRRRSLSRDSSLQCGAGRS
jgi:hypothetical protein